ncbi:MAG: hypothetical protein RLZZ502_1501 [Pseudomonadota bacterium]|jgi:RimJ/RimL family protein N-acetyltransferase
MVIVRPSQLSDIASFWSYIDTVARERLYFGLVEARPLPDTAKFIAECVSAGDRQFVAYDEDRGQVVGGADWHAETMVGFTHSCDLGIGLLQAYRGQGLGTQLLEACLAGARRTGFERMQLSTYSHNTPAIALYKKMGFIEEGRQVRARFLDGMYSDKILMAKFL